MRIVGILLLLPTVAFAQPAINPNRCVPIEIVKKVYEGTTDYVIPLDGLQAERTRAWWRKVMPDDATPNETLILVKRADGFFVLHFGPKALVCSGIVLLPERAMELLSLLEGTEA
jgi:hypothetical protein